MIASTEVPASKTIARSLTRNELGSYYYEQEPDILVKMFTIGFFGALGTRAKQYTKGYKSTQKNAKVNNNVFVDLFFP